MTKDEVLSPSMLLVCDHSLFISIYRKIFIAEVTTVKFIRKLSCLNSEDKVLALHYDSPHRTTSATIFPWGQIYMIHYSGHGCQPCSLREVMISILLRNHVKAEAFIR